MAGTVRMGALDGVITFARAAPWPRGLSPTTGLAPHLPLASLCRLACALALWATALPLHAEQGQASARPRDGRQFVWSAWTQEDGLPQSTVSAVRQTRDGYLWIGTQAGLARFDGVRFTYYTRGTGSLGYDWVRALWEDRAGTLWVGTQGGGFSRLRDGRATITTRKDGLPSDEVRALCESRDGTMWLGTKEGLVAVRAGRMATYTVRHGLPSSSVYSLVETRDGSLWVGTDNGLARWRDGRVVHAYTTRDGLPSNTIYGLREDRDGALWIGTDRGLVRHQDNSLRVFTRRDGLPHDTVYCIRQDRTGDLWFGTEGGLARLHDGVFVPERPADSLAPYVAATLWEDRDGTLWAGTRDGLRCLRETGFRRQTVRDGLPQAPLGPVVAGRDGSLWAGLSGGGVCRLRNGQWERFAPPAELGYDRVFALHQGERSGRLWVGASLDSLNTFLDGRFTSIQGRLPSQGRRDGLGSDRITAIQEDRGGTVWAGTYNNGLRRIRDGQVTILTTRDGLASNTIVALLLDRAGTLWVVTPHELSRRTGSGFQTYTRGDGLPGADLTGIMEDSRGVLWLSSGGGLTRFKDGRFATVTTRHGLLDDLIFQVLEDDRGDFWISASRGLSRVAREQLDAVADGRAQSAAVAHYGATDGLGTGQLLSEVQPAAARAADGRLWFPTTAGLVTVDPQRVRRNSVPPPVHLEKALFDGRPRPPEELAALAPGVEKVHIDYTGVSLTAPAHVRFRYRLEGYDRDWVDAGTGRAAYYMNLSPGHYRFQVTARNNDGVWNAEGAALSFRLLPHYYQTTWFWALCAGLSILTLWLLHRQHVRQIHARHGAVLAERFRLSREIHDTLAQGFVGLSAQLEAVSQMLETTPDVARRHLDLARRMARHSVTEARRSVEGLRAQALDGGSLPEALFEVAERIEAETGIEARVQVTGVPRPLPGPVTQHLLRIAQEATTNALKHAQARRVQVELQFEPSLVRLRVADDGNGFDERTAFSTLGGHFGLLGMRERAGQLGGELALHSAPGRGTEVVVVVPSPANGTGRGKSHGKRAAH